MKQLHKHIKTLELDKILEMLADFTSCDDSREMALNLSPDSNLATVQTEVEKANEALSLTTRYGTPIFHRVGNPNSALKRAVSGGCLSTSELMNIALILRQVRIVREWRNQFEQSGETADTPLLSLFSSLIKVPTLEKDINSVIVSEDEIDDNASSELSNIRRKMKSLGLKTREYLEKMIKSKSYGTFLQEQIITMRDGRFVVPVKSEHKSEVSGIVHDTSASGATLFIEPASVVESNNQVKVLEIEEQKEIQRILLMLSEKCGEQADLIKINFEIIVDLNLYFAKANLAAKMNAVAPTITDDGEISLKKARHPLIDSEVVVPIDVDLGKNYKSLVITGPNTGGKTVTLKTIGLLTLMTMCGLLIPVSDLSKISVFERILVDIGDEQSIEQSLSTFSSHMTNIVSILQMADTSSLVLVDELGSGTDPVEGAALAIAILEELRQKGATTAGTTHYSELKIYALETEGVENACCEFNVETLQPTYRLLVGVPGRSNAFAISQRLGLPTEVLDVAKTMVSKENKRFEDVIENLEESRQEFEQKTKDIEYLNKQASEQKQELLKLRNDFEKQKEREIEIAREKARRLVERVRAESEQIIDELLEIRKQKNSEDFSERVTSAKQKMKGNISKLHDKANPISERKKEEYTLPRILKKGDSVLLVDIDKNGTVITPADKSGNVLVQAGIMKTRVPVSNLRLITDNKSIQISGKTTRTVKSKAERNVKTEIDLRGNMVEEAIVELDMFIDNAVMSGMSIINIIHGKGTGALRTAVGKFLKQHKCIKSHRLGVYGEGEDGVTIAELR